MNQRDQKIFDKILKKQSSYEGTNESFKEGYTVCISDVQKAMEEVTPAKKSLIKDFMNKLKKIKLENQEKKS